MVGISDEYARKIVPNKHPDWMIRANQVGALFDLKSVIPLDEESLLMAARRNTGLSDFGDDGWLPHFRILLKAIEEEAKLHPLGRMLTRADIVQFLETRLMVTEAYKQNPEIEEEVVNPIFIIGMGRTGTTILQELMGHDPQFRAVQKWESLFPCPPPEEATYATDPRIRRAQGVTDIFYAFTPLLEAQHQMGGTIPVEDVEFTGAAFLTELFSIGFDIPTFERHLAEQGDGLHLYWHKRLLKLLQSRFKRSYWVLKNPSHLGRVAGLLETYPNAKFIFTHRDPILALDSVAGPAASVVGLRSTADRRTTDVALERASAWNSAIDVIESGALKPGAYVNFIFDDFQKDKLGTIEHVYRSLDLELTPEVRAKMKALLDSRPKGTTGNANQYPRTAPNSPRAKRERELFRRYQAFFGVPNED